MQKCLHFGNCLGNNPREMCIFQGVDLCRNGMRIIARLDGAGRLENYIAIVEKLIHVVDGDARLPVARLDDILVYTVAVHPLAAMQRNQGRMDVHDGAREGLNQIFRHEQQVARQHNEIDVEFL